MKRIVLTQPAPRVERLARRLRALGHEVACLPARRLVPLGDTPGTCTVPAALAGYDWVVFVSPGAIDVAVAALGADWPAGTGVAVIGPGSAEALADAGVSPAPGRLVMPASPPYDADALLRTPPFDQPAGLRVLVLRGEQGRTDWIDVLRTRGAHVDAVSIYRSEAAEPAADEVARLREWGRRGLEACWVFSTTDSVAACEALVRALGLQPWALRQRALCIHPRIGAAARAAGWSAVEPLAPGERALVAALESA